MDMLSLTACLERQSTTKTLIHQEEYTDSEETKAIATLQSFSLISADIQDKNYTMHRLVQRLTQTWLNQHKNKDKWQERALETVSKSFPLGTYENWKTCESLKPHAVAVLNFEFGSDLALLSFANVVLNLYLFGGGQGRYESTEAYCQHLHRYQKRLLDLKPILMVRISSALSGIYLSQGQ